MYETLLAKIQTTLDSIPRVKQSFNFPKTKITAYPAVFYFPAGFENTYETNAENFKIYRFNMVVMVGVPQKGMEESADVLARTVSAIIAQFDEDWNQGVIDGHRAWAKIDSSESWQVSEEQDGLEMYATLNVEIRLLTTN